MHGIDTMFSVREKPWHYELTKDVTRIIQEAPTSYEALVAAGLNWHVEPKQISVLGTDTAIPNAIANVRDSDGKVLGIVTDRYKVVQNDEAFAFTDTLVGGDVRYETAGSLFGGKRVWLLAKLPTTAVLGDETEPYLCFTNTHDGSGSVRVMVTPIRVVCNNTLNFALSTAKRTWAVRHTGDMNKKIAEARETLELANGYMAALDEYAEKMADIKVDFEKTTAMIEELFGKKDKDMSEREKSNFDTQIKNYTVCYFAPDIVQYQGTAWGALNAMADMVGHAAPNRQSASYAENNWARIMNGHAMVDAFAGMLSGIKA